VGRLHLPRLNEISIDLAVLLFTLGPVHEDDAVTAIRLYFISHKGNSRNARSLEMNIPKKAKQGFWVEQHDSGIMALQANPKPGYVKAEIVAVHLPKDAPIKITAKYRFRRKIVRSEFCLMDGRMREFKESGDELLFDGLEIRVKADGRKRFFDLNIIREEAKKGSDTTKGLEDRLRKWKPPALIKTDQS
jgi:hypothetical protein